MFLSFALLCETNVKFRRMQKKKKKVEYESGFITVVEAPSSCREREGVFNLHIVTNVVSDILSILIMKDSEQAN